MSDAEQVVAPAPPSPRISVIIPAYNHERFLPLTLESVLGQTLAPWEIIVVDDGSTDGTPRVLERFQDRIRALRQANSGVAAARNAGIAASSGELLAFLDADDLWAPEKLERQVARFQAEGDLGLVHCGVDDVDEQGHLLRRHVEGMEGRLVAAEMLLFRKPTILGGGSGVMIPRRVFGDIGGFDPRLSTSADWDLYYRIAARYPIGFVAEPLVKYRLHGTNMHGNVPAMEHDMLLAYEKAFTNPPPNVRLLRRKAYGNLHSVLAGSYFSVGRKGDFVRHAARSLLLTPNNLLRFAGYPLRRFRRRVTRCSE